MSGATVQTPPPRRAAEFALEQMLLGLQRQANVLSELRQRAGLILSATGIVASLFGAQALKENYSRPLAVLAIISTALGIVACMSVLTRVTDKRHLPTDPEDRTGRRWKVTLSWRELQEIAVRGGALDATSLVKDLTMARRVNYQTIKKRSFYFLCACWLLLLQLLLWASVFLERTWWTW
jgi:hypothetical protein